MKSPIMLGKGIIVSVVRLGLPADLDHARWREIGTTLSHLERAVAWWVGDWWAFGEHRYGALREISEDRGWPGPAYQTCANAAAVCRAFEISRRRETLSFSHHEAVAALAPAEQDRLLDQAERERWSRQQLRDAVRSGRSVVRLAVRSIELPTRRSITVPAKRAADRVAVPRIIARVSKAVSPPITYVPPPVPWVAPPSAVPDQPLLTNPDMIKGSAREAECDLAHFLKQFEDSYGGIRGFAPVIERMREAQAMLSQIVLCTT
jgi:hypothetical protein